MDHTLQEHFNNPYIIFFNLRRTLSYVLQKCFSFTVIGWQMPAEFQFRVSTRSVPFASVVGTIRHHTTRRPLGLLLWLGHFLAHQLINQSSSVIHVNRSNLANFYGACQNSRRIFASIPILTLIRHQALSCYGQFMHMSVCAIVRARLAKPNWDGKCPKILSSHHSKCLAQFIF